MLTRPSYGGFKCQPLLHNAQDRRCQTAISHDGCDRSPIRQLRSLLRHPGRCGDTVGPATRDGACPALLPVLFCQLRPSGLYIITRLAPGPPPAWEEVRCRHGPLEEGCPSLAAGVPDLPPRGVRDLHVSPEPPSVHIRTLSRGSRTAACPSAAGVRKALTRRAHGTPHLENCTPYSDDHSACRGWQDAGAISARPRTMARTIATPNAMPHSVLSTVFDHCTPTIRGKTAISVFPYSCIPPLLVSIKGGGGHPLKRSVDSLDTNRSEHTHLLLSPTSTFATLKPYF